MKFWFHIRGVIGAPWVIFYYAFGSDKGAEICENMHCMVIMWVIWLERNAKIFEEKSRDREFMLDGIQFGVYYEILQEGNSMILFPLLLFMNWKNVCN